MQNLTNTAHRGSLEGDEPRAWLGFIDTCQAAIGRTQLDDSPTAPSMLMPALLEAAGRLRTKAERDLSRYVIFKLASRMHRTLRPGGTLPPSYLLDDGGRNQPADALRVVDVGGASAIAGADPRVGVVLRYIGDAHLRSDCRLAEVAVHLRVSRSHLSRLVLRETGNTFKGHLTLARMNTAARCLQETNLSVKEVASMTGYCHVPSFDRQFRQFFGVTPGRFRRLTTGARNS